jgi:hypothetical protein
LDVGLANYSPGDASVGTEPSLYPVEQAADSPAPVSVPCAQGSIMADGNATSHWVAGIIAIVAARDGGKSYKHFMGISPP